MSKLCQSICVLGRGSPDLSAEGDDLLKRMLCQSICALAIGSLDLSEVAAVDAEEDVS